MTPATRLLECVINVSEGRDRALLATFDAAAGSCLLDRHSDPDHNRSVYTLAGPPGPIDDAARRLARAVIGTLDLAAHAGVHPRIGTLDVVPFVALEADATGRLREGPIEEAVAARDRFVAWAGRELELPCFRYGPTTDGLTADGRAADGRAADGRATDGRATDGRAARDLPDLRKQAWTTRAPDAGPAQPHPAAGAAAVGARPVLVAYNLWLEGDTETAMEARKAAAAIRRPGLRTLGLEVGSGSQVSCNLVDPWNLGPGAVYDLVAANLAPTVRIDRAELVGLIPEAVLEAEPAERWHELDLEVGRTIEARLERAGLDGGSEVVPS